MVIVKPGLEGKQEPAWERTISGRSPETVEGERIRG